MAAIGRRSLEESRERQETEEEERERPGAAAIQHSVPPLPRLQNPVQQQRRLDRPLPGLCEIRQECIFPEVNTPTKRGHEPGSRPPETAATERKRLRQTERDSARLDDSDAIQAYAEEVLAATLSERDGMGAGLRDLQATLCRRAPFSPPGDAEEHAAKGQACAAARGKSRPPWSPGPLAPAFIRARPLMSTDSSLSPATGGRGLPTWPRMRLLLRRRSDQGTGRSEREHGASIGRKSTSLPHPRPL